MSKRRPKGATTREAVVVAALQVVDQLGVDALTIRAVAAATGVPPMSLYSHFSNKEQLLDLMYEGVALRLYADTGHADWQMQLSVLCHQIRQVLLEHPNWAPLLTRPAPAIALPLRERVLIMMVNDGIAAEQALSGLTSAILLALGLTIVELSFKRPEADSELSARFDRTRRWTADSSFGEEYPVTRTAYEKLRRLDLRANFEATVAVFIAGLQAQLTSARKPAPRA